MHLNLKQRAIIEIELESISNSIMKIAKNDSGNIKISASPIGKNYIAFINSDIQ